jgi:hypothetical protein
MVMVLVLMFLMFTRLPSCVVGVGAARVTAQAPVGVRIWNSSEPVGTEMLTDVEVLAVTDGRGALRLVSAEPSTAGSFAEPSSCTTLPALVPTSSVTTEPALSRSLISIELMLDGRSTTSVDVPAVVSASVASSTKPTLVSVARGAGGGLGSHRLEVAL